MFNDAILERRWQLVLALRDDVKRTTHTLEVQKRKVLEAVREFEQEVKARARAQAVSP